MSTRYKCVCTNCAQFFQLTDGGGFSFVQWICDSCGNDINLPRFAPRLDRKGRSYPAFLRREGDVDSPPIPENEIWRFTSELELREYLSVTRNWVRSGDEWDRFELEAMLRIKGACICSGTWTNSSTYPKGDASVTGSPHPLLRCPYCQSKKFAFHAAMLFD